MSQPAAAASKEEKNDAVPIGHVRVDFLDLAHFNMMGRVHKVFPLDATTWLHVAEAMLSDRVRTAHTTWSIKLVAAAPKDVRSLIVGIDIPLSDKLLAWQGRVDWASLVCSGLLNPSVPYEHIRFAVSAARAGLVWPLWAADQHDVFNGEAMGCWDDWRRRSGSTVMPRDRSNELPNLIGLTNSSRVIKCCNVWQLGQYMRTRIKSHGDLGVDPFFNCRLPGAPPLLLPDEAARRLLPIWNVETGAVTYPYQEALDAYEVWFQQAEGQAADAVESAAWGDEIRQSNIVSRAYGLVNAGAAIESAVAELEHLPAPQRALQEAKMRAYVADLETDSRSLLEMYADERRRAPQCAVLVHIRRVDLAIKRAPVGKYSAAEQKAVGILHASMDRLSTRHLWEGATIPYSDAFKEERSRLNAAQALEVAAMLARNDWHTIDSVDEVIADDDTNAHGAYARSQLYQHLTLCPQRHGLPVEQSAEERNQQCARAHASAQEMAACACGQNPCRQLTAAGIV